MIKTDDEREEQIYAAVIMRMMTAMVKRAGGELVITMEDLIDTTFKRLALEMLPDGSARLHLRDDDEPRGTRQ